MLNHISRLGESQFEPIVSVGGKGSKKKDGSSFYDLTISSKIMAYVKVCVCYALFSNMYLCHYFDSFELADYSSCYSRFYLSYQMRPKYRTLWWLAENCVRENVC